MTDAKMNLERNQSKGRKDKSHSFKSVPRKKTMVMKFLGGKHISIFSLIYGKLL